MHFTSSLISHTMQQLIQENEKIMSIYNSIDEICAQAKSQGGR